MKKTKIEINRNDFPQELHHLLQNANVYDSSSSTTARVLYSDLGYYIKIAEAGQLREEAERTSLFGRMGLGPEVISYISEEKDYLVTKSVKGQDTTHYLKDPEKLCEVLAEVMHYLHRQPMEGFPVSPCMEIYQKSAERGLETIHFNENYAGIGGFKVHSKQEAWEIIQADKHKLKQDTLIHGDFCLPNVMLDDWKFSSFIDFNLSGVGDKHTDLYWVLWSLQYNLKTDKYTDLFLDLYGRENFDMEMIKVIAAFEAFG